MTLNWTIPVKWVGVPELMLCIVLLTGIRNNLSWGKWVDLGNIFLMDNCAFLLSIINI